MGAEWVVTMIVALQSPFFWLDDDGCDRERRSWGTRSEERSPCSAEQWAQAVVALRCGSKSRTFFFFFFFSAYKHELQVA